MKTRGHLLSKGVRSIVTGTARRTLRGAVRCIVLCIGLSLVAACGTPDAPTPTGTVTSHFQGTFSHNPAVDSIPNYSGFEVLVADGQPGLWDTLAIGTSGEDGRIEMTIRAPRADIFPLQISRSGAVLLRDEIVVADGDSSTVNARFPIGNRPLLIRSRENAALMGFKNTLATHAQAIQELRQAGETDRETYADRIAQSAEILWSVWQSNPETIAGQMAATQSILLLQDWNDSLLVARAREVDPNNPSYQRVVEAARRAELARNGAPAAVTLLEALFEKATEPPARVAVMTELVIAYRDNRQADEAIALARTIQEEFQDSTLDAWTNRAIVDLERLMPGMPAPSFALVTTEGDSISLDQYRGRPLILEFYAPGAQFERDLNVRNAFYRAEIEGEGFELVSISLQPDPELNEAFFDGRDLPGIHVFLDEGPDAEVVAAYNVFVLPTRFLIDAEGRLVGKYVMENATQAFQDALTVSLGPAS